MNVWHFAIMLVWSFNECICADFLLESDLDKLGPDMNFNVPICRCSVYTSGYHQSIPPGTDPKPNQALAVPLGHRSRVRTGISHGPPGGR